MDRFSEQVVPNQNPDLLLVEINNEELVFFPIIAWLIKFELLRYKSIPIAVHKPVSSKKHTIFNRITKEWWSTWDTYDTCNAIGLDTLQKHLK